MVWTCSDWCLWNRRKKVKDAALGSADDFCLFGCFWDGCVWFDPTGCRGYYFRRLQELYYLLALNVVDKLSRATRMSTCAGDRAWWKSEVDTRMPATPLGVRAPRVGSRA
eukprot:gnl/TRDRNA2_/TRDRNA2_138206_c0_seq1.p1 gnl/TRDRNA2_/TRDRNA2_138206_c0~~gnl/TRDRNA2_/TRDRNA2_138206_c0_seq1.p1  ORF type:complete len:110 (+),score=8.07 gnl/TRDRNA2_/TRDRNA2_138206_c0_seq1:239-568(+)